MADALGAAFLARFGKPPTHRARAPGRVNLIGEHTDYNDLPVLPMALGQEVGLLLRPRTDGRVRVENVSDEFAPVSFDLAEPQRPGPAGHWGNYVRAPAVELVRRFGIGVGFDGLIASDVPVASGLSSSSAIVNAMGLALVRLSGLDLDTLAMAEIMAEAERFTGTRGGGMDQAISLGGVAGAAALIEFAPLRLTPVAVPGEWRFVVADTGVRAEKSGAAQAAYNERRTQCEDALRRIVDRLAGHEAAEAGAGGYPGLLRRLDIEGALTAGEAILDGVLAARFRHIVTEARRVRQAVERLRSGDAAGFGALMDDSHRSLRDDFEVSSPALDALVRAAKRGGALGARLTGAGFGGCIVALVDAAGVEGVLSALQAEQVEHAVAGTRGTPAFVAQPSAGASFAAVCPEGASAA